MECLGAREKVLRGKLLDFYKKRKGKERTRAFPTKKDQIDIISRSINRLIDKGLLTGYGKRTATKWFFTFVKLTPQGKKAALKIYKARQQKLF
jgi:hypothetical protein